MEVLRYFARTGSFPHTPPLVGVLEYQPEAGEAMTVGLAASSLAGEGDAWRLTLDTLRRFFDQVLTGAFGPLDLETGRVRWWTLANKMCRSACWKCSAPTWKRPA